MAKHPEEFPVFQAAVKLAEAVTALLERPALRRNRKLHDQIDEANESITANIAEGFEQQSDAAFSRFLYIAKGSAAEVATRLGEAYRKRCISLDELTTCRDLAENIERQLGGFIKYLANTNFKDRGRFRRSTADPPAPDPSASAGRFGDEGLGDEGLGDEGLGIKDSD
ncbi:MAG TPA: four helix bundle protein [Vicinamibacterales bacterium]